jgi:hypothetical protein
VFTSIWNKFSYCRRYSLGFKIFFLLSNEFACFDSISKKTPLLKHSLRFALLHFLLLRFNTVAITSPHYSIARGEPLLLLNLSTLQRPVVLLEVSTPQGPDLHLNVSTLQRPVLHIDVSTPRVLYCIWAWLDNRSLCCSWMCLHYRGAWAAPGRI